MSTSSPFEIPEILRQIGTQITLWECRPHEFPARFFFRPKDLLSCCLVSSFWRKTLLPVLWQCYDESAMSWVPRYVLDRHSRYFVQYEGAIVTPEDRAKTVLPCTNLRVMTFHVSHGVSSQQESEQSSRSHFGPVDSNPGLKSLTLLGTWRAPATLTRLDISHCSNLSELYLHYFQSLPEDFDRLFVPDVAKQLAHLGLVNVRGRYDPSFLTKAFFPNVVQLIIYVGTMMTPPLEELVPLCPNLEKLIVSVESEYRLDRLTKLLKESRIQLKSLHLLTVWIQEREIDMESNELSDSDSFTEPEDYGTAELIRNADRLRELTINVNNLGITQAVVRHHRATLEMLCISVVASEDDVDNYDEEEYNRGQPKAAAQRASFLMELLTCFSRLKVLKFCDTKNTMDLAGVIAFLTAQPWEANSLESLELSEVLGSAPPQSSFRVDENHLWEVQEKPTQLPNMNVTLDAALLTHLFHHVSLRSRVPRLREILLGSACYVKTQ